MSSPRPFRTARTVALLGIAALASGCLNSDNSPVGSDDPATDEEAIEYVLSNDAPELGEVDVRYFDDGSGAQSAPIATERWRRELLRLDRQAEIDIDRPDGGPATASVMLTGEAVGLLHLWAPAAEPDTEPLMVSKDFSDTATRSMSFQKVRRTDRPHRGWRLAALSGVSIVSEGATRRINSVTIQSGDSTYRIGDVSELVAIEDLPAIERGSSVIVTVDTGDATDSVFLHLRHLRHRFELTNNRDGTFTGEFRAEFGPQDDRPSDRPGNRARPRHAVIDVLSDGTLYDDVAPYDNVAWGITYILAGETDLGASQE